MARPRIFISSTFYDLRHVRGDLERAIRDLGYEPVQHERGQIPYGSAERLERYCYKEISLTDLLVHVIGGRFGTTSFDEQFSISQMEFKTAVRLNKQSYVFVESSVNAEYRMWLRNKEVSGIQYISVDDTKIFRFIEEIEALPRNNQLVEFRQTDDIIAHLREQWAGLFQRFLQEQEQLPERRTADELHAALQTVGKLIAFLTEERRQQGSAIDTILHSSHPMFAQLRQLTNTPYPLYLQTKTELAAWLEARGYKAVPVDHWDDPSVAEWMRTEKGTKRQWMLKINTAAFEGERIKVYTAADWDQNWISQDEWKPKADPFEDLAAAIDDDDLPF